MAQFSGVSFSRNGDLFIWVVVTAKHLAWPRHIIGKPPGFPHRPFYLLVRTSFGSRAPLSFWVAQRVCEFACRGLSSYTDETRLSTNGSTVTIPDDRSDVTISTSPSPGKVKRLVSTWDLLKAPLFRAIWLGALFSNIGGLMHETAAVWTMAGLVDSPLWVSLLQTCMSLPLFFLGLPAGALGDLVSPRRVLVVSESFLGFVAISLGVVAALGLINAPLLLTATLLLGIGTAFSLPAWQALLPELVKREEVPSAVALNGLSVNLARAIGPAAGGLLLASTGPTVCFVLNGLSYITIAWVLLRSKRQTASRDPSGEHFWPALLAGKRYVWHAPLLRLVMLRMVGFVLPATGAVALFPLLVRREWELNALGFGALMTAYGLGAVLAATWLPRLRSRFSIRAILALACLLYAVFGFTLVFGPGGWVMLPAMPLGGAGWILTISTLNAAAQATAAAWVRSRALSFNLLCFQGALAIGALLWGSLAVSIGVKATLLCSVIVLLAVTLLVQGGDLEPVKELNLDPASNQPDQNGGVSDDDSDKRALVSVEYNIDASKRQEFLSAVGDLGIARLRTGATHWEIVEEIGQPGRFQERFTVSSWAEHLQQHKRMTQTDEAKERIVDAFHIGIEPPVVRHWIQH
ncbi:MAG: MFS transporter [Opitutaceae bacterium]|nr:MFS transporter [Opitutaceae bacterium]